jgi:general secretion pathway protein K
VSPLSLLTFFAAAKKVSAAPHRGEANRPTGMQGQAKTAKPPTKQRAAGKKKQPHQTDKKNSNPETKR